MYQDIWASDAFASVSMTKSINKMQYVPDFFEKELDWDVDTSLTRTVGMDVENDRVILLPITPRGGQLTTLQRTDREAIQVPIQRWGNTESVLNEEVIGVRETGTMAPRTLQSLANKKLMLLKANCDATANWSMACALSGLVVDAVSRQVVLNLHTLLGTTPTVLNYDFSVVQKFNLYLAACKRYIEDKMGSYQLQVTRYTLMCGRNFYRALLADPSIQASYTDYQVKTATLRFLQADREIPGGFVLADDVYVVDAGVARIPTYDVNGNVIGANGYIDDNSAFLVPNAPGNARRVFGPSALGEFMGVPQPYYAAQKIREWNDGIDIRGETYQLNYFARPDLNLKITGQNIVVPAPAFPDLNPSAFGPK
jgi:hypothetical protein